MRAVSVFSRFSKRMTAQTASNKFAVRAFSNYGNLTIPEDKDQQGGRRKEEIESEAKGIQGFNRDPVIPTHDQGTKENPILVSHPECLLLGVVMAENGCYVALHSLPPH